MTELIKGEKVRCWPGTLSGRHYLAEVISDGVVMFGGTRCYRIRKEDGGTDYMAVTHVRPLTSYQLGERVRFASYLERRYVDNPDRPTKWEKKWMPKLTYKGELDGAGEGIIIGKRTLVNGENRYNGHDEPITFIPKERVTAWLVAYDLRRKPVHVLPEHITPVDET